MSLSHRAGLFVEQLLSESLHYFSKIPGSAIVERYVRSSHQNDPLRTVFELLLMAFAIHYFLASKRPYNQKRQVKFSKEETDELVSDWHPEPLVESFTEEEELLLEETPIIDGHNGPLVHLDGHQGSFVNFTSNDIHNFSQDESQQEIAIETVKGYGVGSCGPAGFYGNQDAHRDAEADLAKFLGAEMAIYYAQDMATAVSVIPCFAKRGDYLVIDEAANMSLQKGALLSRCKVFWYKHNDMEDLEHQLAKVNRLYKSGPLPRRFIITEGLFEYTGNSPDLAKIIELKAKYKWRLILDESWSLGVLGKTGRGLPEEQNVSRKDIEITVGSLAHAFGSAGGFCAGEEFMVTHQRIVSLAYTFSATPPPYLARCTSGIVKKLSNESFSTKLLNDARAKGSIVAASLSRNKKVELISRADTPYLVFRLADSVVQGLSDMEITVLLSKVIRETRKSHLLVSRLLQISQYEKFAPIHAVRLAIPNALPEAEIKTAATALSKAITKALKD